MEGNLLKEIDLEAVSDEMPYCLRYRLEDPGLEESISAFGILVPVVLTRDKPYRILSGHKRIALARRRNQNKIQAFLAGSRENPREDLIFSLLSNWKQEMDELDRFWALSRFIRAGLFSEEELLRRICPVLGLPGQRYALEEAEKISGLHREVLEAVSKRKLSCRGIGSLACFSLEEQADFSLLVAERIQLTSSRLRQSAGWLLDLCREQEVSLRKCLDQSPLKDILCDPVRDRVQKGEAFFKTLRNLRHPRLAAHEKRFYEFARRIRPAKKELLQIEPPPYFEDRGFILHSRLRNAEALDELIAMLRQEQTSLNSLFDLML